MTNETIEQAAQEMARVTRLEFDAGELRESKAPYDSGIDRHKRVTLAHLVHEAVMIMGLPMNSSDADTIDMIMGPLDALDIGNGDTFWEESFTDEDLVAWRKALYRARAIVDAL